MRPCWTCMFAFFFVASFCYCEHTLISCPVPLLLSPLPINRNRTFSCFPPPPLKILILNRSTKTKKVEQVLFTQKLRCTKNHLLPSEKKQLESFIQWPLAVVSGNCLYNTKCPQTHPSTYFCCLHIFVSCRCTDSLVRLIINRLIDGFLVSGRAVGASHKRIVAEQWPLSTAPYRAPAFASHYHQLVSDYLSSRHYCP